MAKIKRWLGLEKRSADINTFFDTANFRSSIYMSVVIIVLEVWMLLSLLKRWIAGDPTRTRLWFIQHFAWYMILLTAAVCMLVYAVFYLKGRFKKAIPGKIIMVIFSAVSLYFGISVSYSDYTKGEQILCFVMMVIFVVGLINWRPVVSILLSTFVFVLFYNMMKNAPEVVMSYATQVNFFTLWVSVVMLSTAVYSQRLSEAEKNESLETSAVRDELTSLPNMSYFRKKAGEILAEDGPEGKLFLFLDIANFKAFNEKYGFDAGNDFIKSTAQKVKTYFENDLYARYSDDHFVVLTDKKNIKKRLSDLTREVRGQHESTHLTLKAGGYSPDSASYDPSIALDHARYACSTIKKHFDSFYCEYDKEMDEGFHKRQYIITHLRSSIRNGYVKVYYQPVVSSKDHTLCGLEALARWIDPNYGFLSPGEFIPALEEYRLIQYLDRAVLEQVCKDIRSSIDSGSKPVPVSVNFSRLDFELMDVCSQLKEVIRRYDIPADLLHAEVTESTLTSDAGNLRSTLQSIRDLGIELWLDDFGSGYSSLNVLKEFSFDMLKIDMVFLKNFNDNDKSKAILDSIVKMARSIDIKTLTEGVEEESQAEFLKEIGCDLQQGYLFGKPMPVDELKTKFTP